MNFIKFFFTFQKTLLKFHLHFKQIKENIMNPFYIFMLLSFFWEIAFAAQVPNIIIQPDINPADQHLTALAIELKNSDTAAAIKLPDPLIALSDNTRLMECSKNATNSYCGLHHSTCVAGNYLDPNSSCLIWVAANLPTTSSFPTLRNLKINVLPHTKWEKILDLSYKIISYICASDQGNHATHKIITTPDETFWHLINLNDEADVRAAALWNSDLYVGGFFTIPLQNYSIHNIARWNGVNWSALGSNENNGVNKTVYTLADWNNELYVGGNFDTADGQTTKNIARWNGEQWSSLQSGVYNPTSSSYVFSLLPTENYLYVGGRFTLANTALVNNIARWNGEQWLPLNLGTNGNVYALTAFQGGIYAGGEFTQVDNKAIPYLAYWKQDQWNALPAQLDGAVYTLTANNNNLYAGGDFTHADTTPTMRIAAWNTLQWMPLTTGVDNSVYSLVYWNNNLFVGGGFSKAGDQQSAYMALWNDVNWQNVNNAGINAFVFSQVIVPQIKLSN